MSHHRPPSPPLDPSDLAVLTLQRHFFRSFAEPASQAWMQAFGHDDPAFAHLPRGEIALLVLTQLEALRRVRRTVFRFNDPFCPCCAPTLTRDERNLSDLLQAARLRPGLLSSRCALLSDGTPNPGLEIATLRLAEALGPWQASGMLH